MEDAILGNIDSNPKLKELAEIEGYDDPMELLQSNVTDSVSPGICTNEGCSYTCEVEPDQSHGWCENCETQTVASCMILAGVI